MTEGLCSSSMNIHWTLYSLTILISIVLYTPLSLSMAQSPSSSTQSKSSLNLQEIDEAFTQGKNAYLYGTYPLVIKSLHPLLNPHILISNPQKLLIAYEYLGLAYFYLNQKQQARATFTRLIFFRPNYELDPVRIPPDAVTFYTQIKEQLASEIKKRQDILKKQKEQEERRRKAKMSREVVLERQVNQYPIAILPFGIGQFQNHDYGMGYFFLISEILTLSASVGFFWGVENLRQSNGLFTQANFTQAQNLQTAQMVSVGLTVGLMITGIVHALMFYKESFIIRRFERPLGSSMIRPQSTFKPSVVGLSLPVINQPSMMPAIYSWSWTF